MARRQITAADLSALTGYSRDQLRGLLAELPLFAQRKGSARVANIYSSHDVLVVALCCRLETQYGLKRATVAALSEVIAPCLAVPRPLTKGARLVLDFQLPVAHYVERVGDLADGLVVALDPVFAAIDACLAPAFSSSSMTQRDLKFPRLVMRPAASPRRLMAIGATRSRKRAAR